MANPELIKFIREARRRGFADSQIREPLIKNNWPPYEVDEALKLIPAPYGKRQFTISLDNEVVKIIEKRSKKNLLSIEEQIEDIVRRSCVNLKTTKKEEKNIDDLLVSIFSRKKRKKS